MVPRVLSRATITRVGEVANWRVLYGKPSGNQVKIVLVVDILYFHPKKLLTTNGKNLYFRCHFLLTPRIGEFGEGRTNIFGGMVMGANHGSGRKRWPAHKRDHAQVPQEMSCFTRADLDNAMKDNGHNIIAVIDIMAKATQESGKRLGAYALNWLQRKAKYHESATSLLQVVTADDK